MGYKLLYSLRIHEKVPTFAATRVSFIVLQSLQIPAQN